MKLVTSVKWAGALAVVSAAGLLVGWFGTQGVPSNSPAASTLNDKTPSSPSVDMAMPASTDRPQTTIQPAQVVVAEMHSALLTNWEEAIEDILSSEADNDSKSAQMLELFPRLPEDGQIVTAQHLASMLADTNYSALGSYLTNSATAEPVLNALLAGLLSRPDGVKLPWLLEVARQEQNPKAEEARQYLRLFLEMDHWLDWRGWQASVEERLRDDPD